MALIGLAIWAGSPCSKDGWQLLERCVWVSLISAAVNNTGMEKISLQDLYPPRPARNGTPVKGRWGWISRCRRRKIIAAGPILPKDDGVGSMVMITMAVGSMTSATGPCETVINYANDLWEIHESLVEAHLSAGRKTR
jgi:hypothetical protein